MEEYTTQDEIEPLEYCDDCEHVECLIARDIASSLRKGLVANDIIKPNK